MNDQDRLPWLRLWRRDLERYVDGPYIPSVSLALDLVTVKIEGARA